MNLDLETLNNELRKCEEKKESLRTEYESRIAEISAEMRVYRNLIRKLDGSSEKFSKWLDQFMKRNGFTYKEVGELIGYSHTAVYNWLKGSPVSAKLSGDVARKLCDVADGEISYDELYAMIRATADKEE